MATIAFNLFITPSNNYSPLHTSSRFTCCATSPSSGHHQKKKLLMDFPYVSAPHKKLMVELVSSVEGNLDGLLNPCSLPPDVQSYGNETDTSHAALHLRTGLNDSPVAFVYPDIQVYHSMDVFQIDYMLGSWLHCGLPTGGTLNITTLYAYLNSSTDAPNLLVELIQSSPTSMVLIVDLPPRMDLVLNPDYLKTFYEDTQLDQHRQYLEKLPEVKPHFSSSLYIRTIFSPTAILVRIETEQIEEMIETHVTPIAKEVLKTWLDICAFGKRTVGDSERDYLKKRDHMTKSKAIEIDLGSSLPRMFGKEFANRDSGPSQGLYLCRIVLRYRCARTELITPNLICHSTHQLLRSSGDDSGPDLSFDKSASPERLFSLAHAILDAIVWRHPNAAIDDPRSVAGSFNMDDVQHLSAHVIKLRDMLEGVLALSGLSRVWKSRVYDPVLWGANGNVMGIYDFLYLPE
ncbi:red chlorophyll catabolite reductase, chloroplastic [Tanacetum coccineum]